MYLWHGVTFAAQPCRTLPLCAARHSVDVPLRFLKILAEVSYSLDVREQVEVKSRNQKWTKTVAMESVTGNAADQPCNIHAGGNRPRPPFVS